MFLGARADAAALLAALAAVRVAGLLMTRRSTSTSRICWPAALVLVSFLLLYQDRMFALLNVFALQAIVLALSVAWQA